MGSYKDAISWGIARNAAPDIDSVGKAGNTKLGFGVNIEQELSPEVGLFMRAGWNDGKNETWAFTEVDQHVSVGANLSGNLWKRPNDNLGIAQIVNGISTDHRSYLKAAGIGFIIGDGNLSYRPECITEVYYSFKLQNYPFWLSPDYQLIVNPAYNRARGPVNAFGIRAHLEL
jgi:Carbohydrate-selective porin